MFNLFGSKSPQVPESGSSTIEREVLAKRLNAVIEVNHRIAGFVDKEEILQLTTEKLISLLNVSYAVIWLYHEDTHQLKLAHLNVPPTVSKLIERFMGFSIPETAFSTDDPIHRENFMVKTFLEGKLSKTTELSDASYPLISKQASGVLQSLLNVKFVLHVPLTARDNKFGVMGLIWNTETFTKDDEDLVMAFADQISTGIYNSQLFSQVENQVNVLENKNQEITSLYNLTNRISQTLDPKLVAQTAVDSLPQDQALLGAFVNFYDKEHGGLVLKAVTKSTLVDQASKLVGGFEKYNTNVNDPQYQNNPIVKAVLTQQIQISNTLDPIVSPPLPPALLLPLNKIANIGCVIVYPLRTREEVLGTISFIIRDKKYEGLEESKKQLISTYALQIGIALENASLFQNLATALEQLKEVRRREHDMIDVMGHELRTPISIVRNALLMLERSFDKSTGAINKETLSKYLDMSVESTRREITLIETLLSATKVDASRMQLFLSKVDFKDVVNDGIEGQKTMLQQKALGLVYTPPAEDIFVYADRTRAQEVMDNFLSNSAKYTQAGQITISIWKDQDYGWISIKDTGIGISEEDLQNLGKKFFRARQYIPTQDPKVGEYIRPGGTGLGLYVTFDLIRIMGGTLYINSKVGEGSNFTFSLPLYKNEPDKQIDETFSADDAAKKQHVILNGQAPQPPAGQVAAAVIPSAPAPAVTPVPTAALPIALQPAVPTQQVPAV